MSVRVLTHALLVDKTLAAETAEEWLLTSVPSEMCTQMSEIAKALLTHVALVRFLAGVTFDVRAKV